MGSGMRNNGRLQTAQPEFFFFDKQKKSFESSQITADNVLDIFYVPMGTCPTDISPEELADKAKSKGGLKCCLLPADALIVSLCLLCNTHFGERCRWHHLVVQHSRLVQREEIPPCCTPGHSQQRQEQQQRRKQGQGQLQLKGQGQV